MALKDRSRSAWRCRIARRADRHGGGAHVASAPKRSGSVISGHREHADHVLLRPRRGVDLRRGVPRKSASARSVVVVLITALDVAHQWAYSICSNGRGLGVGIGREHHYRQFEVPQEGRVSRFREELEVIRALWTEETVTYQGRFYHLENETMAPKPVQQPLPIWMGVGHPDAVRRAARLADGWMRSGGSRIADFAASVPILKEALEKAGRDPAKFPISKRVFMAVDERPEAARAELLRWFTDVYRNRRGSIFAAFTAPRTGPRRLEEMVAMGQPPAAQPGFALCRAAQALAEVVGLK